MKYIVYQTTCKINNKIYVGGKVGRFDDNGNLLEEFNTMTDCVKAGYKNAKLVTQGKREHCKGFVFKYLD